MTFDQFENAEPALVSGLFTGSAGFLALMAANFGTVHSAGLAVGMSASQTLLTRPAVYSPRSVRQITGAGGGPPTIPPDLFQAGSGFARPDEPAATIGVFVFLAGFLVQLFSGVEVIPALTTAAGIAGVQTAAIRARAYSPAATQIHAALSLALTRPDETGETAAAADGDVDRGGGDAEPTTAPGPVRTAGSWLARMARAFADAGSRGWEAWRRGQQERREKERLNAKEVEEARAPVDA